MANMTDDLKSMINHHVVIRTKKSHQKGYLVCCDPVSNTALIYNDTQQTLTMIFINSIVSITQIDNSLFSCDNFKQFCDDFFNKSNQHPTDSDNNVRRQFVLDLFSANNVPVEEVDDVLIAAYSVCINPPYTEHDCQSSNPIVLDRIKTILKSRQ